MDNHSSFDLTAKDGEVVFNDRITPATEFNLPNGLCIKIGWFGGRFSLLITQHDEDICLHKNLSGISARLTKEGVVKVKWDRGRSERGEFLIVQKWEVQKRSYFSKDDYC